VETSLEGSKAAMAQLPPEIRLLATPMELALDTAEAMVPAQLETSAAMAPPHISISQHTPLSRMMVTSSYIKGNKSMLDTHYHPQQSMLS
jgi:hypothetical protein